ncbi:MAG: porin family protein [Cytophagaceae bacterium]
MKKLWSICLLAISIATQAQVDIGVKGGLSLGNFSGRYDKTFNQNRLTRGGIQLGFYGTYDLADKVKLYTELSYAYLSAGFKYKDASFNNVQVLDIYNFHYLQLPILVQYHFNEKWHLGTGPQFNFLLGANYHVRYNGDNGTHYDAKPSLNSTDIGWVFKGGYNFNEKLQGGIHWYTGLSGLYKDNRDGLKHLRQMYVSFYVSYSLYKK